MEYISRLFNDSSESYFLFGPRGCGKTTWLQHHYPDALWINLLKPEVLRLYSAMPERLEVAVLGANKPVVIIDEVQKMPELLSVVHDLIERKLNLQFVLTGSSVRKLKRTGVNLLAGRAVIRHLHAFMAAELGNKFNLETALRFGLVPLIVASSFPDDVLRAYISLYLQEEVKAEGLVRNIGDFSRFLEVISFSHGAILNIANIARECMVSRKLIEGYLSVLEDLLLGFCLPVFTKRAKRATVMHPKFYYFDAGIFHSLRFQGPLDKNSEILGAALEGLVAQHLRAWNDYQGSPYALYYWRTRNGVEVDFIVYGPKGFYAIEVKNGKQVYNQDLRGLQTFCNDYPEAKPLLVYRGKEKLRIKNILCLPADEFLRSIHPDKNLGEE